MNGSNRQFKPTKSAPALAIRTAHSPRDTPSTSPLGPTQMVAATGFLAQDFTSSMAHSISSTFRKY